MHHVIAICALTVAAGASAFAQPSTTASDDQYARYKGGLVTCNTEKAMVTLMKADLPNGMTNMKVLDGLVKTGDCLMMPSDWDLITADDPPLDQQGDHASKWTIRTPHGIIHMWGTPFGGD